MHATNMGYNTTVHSNQGLNFIRYKEVKDRKKIGWRKRERKVDGKKEGEGERRGWEGEEKENDNRNYLYICL